MHREDHILHSWQQNVEAWSVAVRENQIESRKLVTNQAITDALLRHHPPSLLDIGCGEGWLSRIMAAHRIKTYGVDAIPGLIERAAQYTSEYLAWGVHSYQDIVGGSLQEYSPFEAVVCNFSLFGQASVDDLIRYLPTLLTKDGRLFIQTLHPLLVNQGQPYQDGWRAGSWQGFSDAFTNPAPWYYRTIGSWMMLLTHARFNIQEVIEPLNPFTHQPASLLLVAQVSED